MKICLITPPSGFLLDERVFMSLGILKVGAVLEQAGYEVDHLDLTGVKNYETVCRDYVSLASSVSALSRNDLVFAITATTPQIPAAIRIRKTLPGKAILGGPHPTLLSAAAKRGNERAREGLGHLLDAFDTVVAGDGERAIFRAIREYGLIDADDPKSELWEPNNFLSPWPARHLVDVDSYHYTIDGERALSVIAQLGCLTPETPIMLGSMRLCPISDIRIGDTVRCWDAERKAFSNAPVKAVYRREATDIWEVAWDNGVILRITGEHPILTPDGWNPVWRLEQGAVSASLHSMQSPFHCSVSNTAGEVLQSPVSMAVATGECERKVAQSRTGSDAQEVWIDDCRAEAALLLGREEQFTKADSSDSTEVVRYEEGCPQPNEASRSSRESIENDQGQVGRVLRRAHETELEDWAHYVSRSVSPKLHTQYVRNRLKGLVEGNYPGVRVGRKRSVLDWALHVWNTAKSRLYRQGDQEGNSLARGVLAQRSVEGDRVGRLHQQGLVSARSLVERTQAQEQSHANPQTAIVWSTIISKRLIGAGTVCNITVHPHHNYIANGMIVHNCPFECGFCGGRFSPMLRRARPRQFSLDILAEMVHLYDAYGVKGIMFYDDEINVNRGLIPMLRAIKNTGIDWRLRAFVKAELFTEEQAEAMYAAGFRWLLCGFESAHPKILRNINKKATLEDNTRMLRTAHKSGLKVKALMSLGHPGESAETIVATRDWLLEEKPDDFDATVITTYPGTPYWDNAQPFGPHYRYQFNGDALYMDDVDFTRDAAFYKGHPGEYKAFVWTDHLLPDQLCTWRDWVESTVREALNIPYPTSAAAVLYEHSVGMNLPSAILRSGNIGLSPVVAGGSRLIGTESDNDSPRQIIS